MLGEMQTIRFKYCLLVIDTACYAKNKEGRGKIDNSSFSLFYFGIVRCIFVLLVANNIMQQSSWYFFYRDHLFVNFYRCCFGYTG